jgi:hypothetical protein
MPLEAHYDRCVLKCGSCGEELTKLGRMAPLAEAAAAGWGLIVEPNGAHDYVCSVCLAKPKAARGQTLDIAAAQRSRSRCRNDGPISEVPLLAPGLTHAIAPLGAQSTE